MSDEKLVSLMQDARLIAACDNVIFPLLEKQIKERIDLACGKFANGETNFVSDIAYIFGLKEISNQLKQKQTQGNKIFSDLNIKTKE